MSIRQLNTACPASGLRRISRSLALIGALFAAVPCFAQERVFIDAASVAQPINSAVPPGVLALAVPGDAFATLSAQQSVALIGLSLSPELNVDLELDRFWAWGPGSQFVVGTDRGDVPMSAPPVVFFRGTVAGVPDSKVFLSASPSGLKGVVRFGRSQYILEASGAPAQLGKPRVHHGFDALSPLAATPPAPFGCTPVEVPGHVPPFASGIPGPHVQGASRVALVAVDADFDFRQRFVSVGDAAMYVCELMAAVGVFYETDVNLKLALSFVRIWDTAADPYSAANTGDQLNQFKNFWEANMGSVPRNTAHLMTTRDLGGGIAFLDQMCGGSNAYGVSANMGGSFPRPPQSGNGGNWDLVVVAHELGHNFSSPHTHCYSPPVDRCNTSEGGCASGTRVCQQGTIMSYCHTCSGGIANIDLTFGPAVSSHISSNLVACVGPARNPCFVNASFGGAEQGTSTNPMRSIARGTWYVVPNGTVSIAAGSYPERMTICQPMRLTATGGLVSIGR